MAQETSLSSLKDRVESAVRDLEMRTLGNIPGIVAQLVYLASTRDYNTAEYHHDGLAFRFGQDAAEQALGACHARIFQKLVLLPLGELCEDVSEYLDTSDQPDKTMDAWRRLKAYQLLVPNPCDPVSASLFSSNIELALGLLVHRKSVSRTRAMAEGAG